MSSDVGTVFMIKTDKRAEGIETLLENYDLTGFQGKNIALKANFNSADPFPASSHPETVQTLVKSIKNHRPSNIILAERSGMGNTREVLEKMKIMELGKKEDFDVRILDEEDIDEWLKIDKEGTHWLRGFYISKIFTDADKVVQTCCLKAHRFGGHFTLSLKNSVGIVAKKVPGGVYNYMGELHISPYQRSMIAEINKYYNVDLILMDGMKAFVDKGPEQGQVIEPNLIMMSDDRVAIDAVGVAILRHYGTTRDISKGNIFELEQIRKAAELDIGINSADKIKIVGLNPESEAIAGELEQIL
ncbi:MAG TPA: DUF362 domain-containing protein, partial [Methanobacterium sp.]